LITGSSGKQEAGKDGTWGRLEVGGCTVEVKQESEGEGDSDDGVGTAEWDEGATDTDPTDMAWSM
jgi:hypothetical protein